MRDSMTSDTDIPQPLAAVTADHETVPGSTAPDPDPDAVPALPRRRAGEILTLTQLTTDEIIAELDRRDRRSHHLVARQEKLRAELAEVDRQIADIGESLPALVAAASQAEPDARPGRGGRRAAAPRRSRGQRAKNTVSLGDAIAQAVEVRAVITPAEAADLVRRNGYVSTAGNFQMTVANTLAKDGRFRRVSRGVYERVA